LRIIEECLEYVESISGGRQQRSDSSGQRPTYLIPTIQPMKQYSEWHINIIHYDVNLTADRHCPRGMANMVCQAKEESPTQGDSKTANSSMNFARSVVRARHKTIKDMIDLKRDKKAKNCWLITTTDSEGLHRQLPITYDDMTELVRLWINEII